MFLHVFYLSFARKCHLTKKIHTSSCVCLPRNRKWQDLQCSTSGDEELHLHRHLKRSTLTDLGEYTCNELNIKIFEGENWLRLLQ